MRHAKVFGHFFLWVLIFFFLDREATAFLCLSDRVWQRTDRELQVGREQRCGSLSARRWQVWYLIGGDLRFHGHRLPKSGDSPRQRHRHANPHAVRALPLVHYGDIERPVQIKVRAAH